MKTYHKVLFWIGMLLLAVLSFSVDLSAKPKPTKDTLNKNANFGTVNLPINPNRIGFNRQE